MTKFGLIICSDFEYEKPVVDLQFDHEQVAVLNSDCGIENAEIRFFGIEQRILLFNFKLTEFINFLKQSLKEFREISLATALDCKRQNEQDKENIFYSTSKDSKNTNESIFELYYGSLHFANLTHNSDKNLEISIFDPNSTNEIWKFDGSEFICGLEQAFNVLNSNYLNQDHFYK